VQGQCDELKLLKGADSALKVECEQLRIDNDRLLAMLRGTKEYQEFAGFVEDSGGNVVSKTAIDEWLPNEAFQLAHQFRERNGNDLTPALINQLLGDLNKIWRDREKRQIARIK
jgi:hypothetical protein